MTLNSYDYYRRNGILSISWNEFHAICKGIARAAASFQPDIILPIGRGGYYPGTLLSHMLQVELYPIRLSRRIADAITFETPRWLVRPPTLVSGKRVLVVDEIASTGETLDLVRTELRRMGASAVNCAVVAAHTAGLPHVDIAGLISDALILNPWDREIFLDGKFACHPEYQGAFAQQGLLMTPDDLLVTDEKMPAKHSISD